jgi:16S rRNA (cytosine1402-N4)-methyltransferase
METHIPVLLNEVLQCLDPQPNQNFIDCTLGFGGHTIALLEKIKPNGKILGIEWDNEKLKIENEKLKMEERLKIVNDSYVNLREIVQRENFGSIDSILLDLGLSSWEISDSGRGFSFQKDEPLDMRFFANAQNDITARRIVNGWSEEELVRIFREYGQERFAKNIASNLVKIRKQQAIETTFQLVEVIQKSFPRSYKFGKAHFATRVFQALRIAVNDELRNLEKVLPQALEILKPGGKVAVISFHSLEDRLVKVFFREQVKLHQISLLTKKPLTPSLREIKDNPRSRSAKLRAIIKN